MCARWPHRFWLERRTACRSPCPRPPVRFESWRYQSIFECNHSMCRLLPRSMCRTSCWSMVVRFAFSGSHCCYCDCCSDFHSDCCHWNYFWCCSYGCGYCCWIVSHRLDDWRPVACSCATAAAYASTFVSCRRSSAVWPAAECLPVSRYRLPSRSFRRRIWRRRQD